MSLARKEFKAALKYVQNNQEKIKMDILARHESSKNFAKFWKEVKKLNPKSGTPVSVEGETDRTVIANKFRKHFDVSPPDRQAHVKQAEKLQYSNSGEAFHVTADDVLAVLKGMRRGRSPGHDGLSLEHLLNAGQYIGGILSQFFNLCANHCYLPADLIRTLVVPIPKNRTGDVSSMANYRPISLATVVAKVLERLIHKKLSPAIKIDDGQFGFRPEVSTDMAIFSLKQVVKYYVDQDTSVYACFLDLSRAFDTINHDLLWGKLERNNVPSGITGLIRYWYCNQFNNVRWNCAVSEDYRLACGVRQGGLTSPDLFNLYVNDLIEELSRVPVGLRLGDRFVNNLSYADDMVLLSPSIKGLRKLLIICDQYAKNHDLVYNAKKTELMIFRSGKGPQYVPPVSIGGQTVKVVERFRYLGHILTSNMRDDADIDRQRRALSVVGNMVARRFFKANVQTKVHLFRTYCQSFYTCQLWTEYSKKSWDGIRVQYNNIYRHLMGLNRNCSASGMFAEARLNAFNAIQRNRIASFLSRVGTCRNRIVKELADRIIGTKTYRRWLDIAA